MNDEKTKKEFVINFFEKMIETHENSKENNEISDAMCAYIKNMYILIKAGLVKIDEIKNLKNGFTLKFSGSVLNTKHHYTIDIEKEKFSYGPITDIKLN